MYFTNTECANVTLWLLSYNVWLSHGDNNIVSYETTLSSKQTRNCDWRMTCVCVCVCERERASARQRAIRLDTLHSRYVLHRKTLDTLHTRYVLAHTHTTPQDTWHTTHSIRPHTHTHDTARHLTHYTLDTSSQTHTRHRKTLDTLDTRYVLTHLTH